MQKTLFLLVSVVFFAACSKKYTSETLPAQRLQFGTGGGFTGLQNAYLLLDNGQIFKQKDFDGKKFEAFGKIPSSVAKTFYKQCKSYEKLKVNRPADLYHFITLKNDSTNLKWQWGDGVTVKDSTVNSLLKLHKTLLGAIPKEK
jgi:hypothetical protein